MSKKVCVFIDVGNQYYCVNKKWDGRKLDYEKYLKKCKEYGEIERAFAYGTQIEDYARTFISCLFHIGFEPNYKQVEKGEWFSWDVGIATEIVRLISAGKADTIIIGHSNRQMAPIISWAREQGIRTIIMGCGINKDLKEACDQWIEIKDTMLEELNEKSKKEKENEVTETTE